MKYICIVLLVLFSFPGCESKSNHLIDRVNQLKQSSTASAEKENATRLNEFSNEHHVSYRLEIRRHGDSSPVNSWALEEHIDSKLNVTISMPDSDYSVDWTPVDNNNIFILLRE